MPGYEYQVFVSYRRAGDWSAWVTRLFVTKLENYLAVELPGEIRIFTDVQIPPGPAWELAINEALDASCLMVPVFMNNYFSSDWCRRELARMLHREKALGYRTAGCNKALIIPVRLSERSYFPALACAMQDVDLCRFALPHMHEASQVHQDFDQAMHRFCKSIVKALDDVPGYEPAWAQLDGSPFFPQLLPKPSRVTLNPRLAA